MRQSTLTLCGTTQLSMQRGSKIGHPLQHYHIAQKTYLCQPLSHHSEHLQEEAIHTKESRKQKARGPKDRAQGTEQPLGNARVLQDPDQSGPSLVTEQSGPLGATDTTSQLEAGETATPDNTDTIVMELPE